MLHLLGFALAAVIGLALGILGGGGSVLTVPIFVYVMEYDPKLAIAMSLPVVGATSLVGALGHWRGGNFNLRIAVAFGVLAMAGAYLGARLAANVPGVIQLALLGVVMLAAAALMLRRAPATPLPSAHAPSTAPSRVEPGGVDAGGGSPGTTLVLALVGVLVGALTGLVGVGGGFLFVPALVLLLHVPMKTAVGTSLFVIAMNTVAASLGYRGQVDIPWETVLLFMAIAIGGVFTGAQVHSRVSQEALRRIFAYFLFAVAAFILFQNRAVFAHPSQTLRPSSAGVR